MREHSLRTIGRFAGSVVPIAVLALSAPLLAAPPTVKISLPKEGAVVNSGQTLAVTVDATPLVFQKVLIEGEDPIASKALTGPPYEFKISIPLNVVPGTRMFNAVGVIRPGITVDSDPVTIDIERPDSPRRLWTDLRSIHFDDVGDDLALVVFGIFEDGSEIDLIHSTRTTFASDNTAVAKVARNSVITSVGPGSAKITITNGEAALTIPVVVEVRRMHGNPGH